MELIRWAKSLDNGQVGGEKGGSTTFSMKTSKLFSPNAWGKILGAFHPPRQPDIKHMNLHPIFFFWLEEKSLTRHTPGNAKGVGRYFSAPPRIIS